MKPSDSGPNLLAEFFPSSSPAASLGLEEEEVEVGSEDSSEEGPPRRSAPPPFAGSRSAPPPPPSMRGRKSAAPPPRGIGLPLAARPRSVPPRPPSARRDPPTFDESDIDLEWDIEDRPALKPVEPVAVASNIDVAAEPSAEPVVTTKDADAALPAVDVEESETGVGVDSSESSGEPAVATAVAETVEAPSEEPAQPALAAESTEDVAADSQPPTVPGSETQTAALLESASPDERDPDVATSLVTEAKSESVHDDATSPGTDFGALVLAAVSDTDLTRPLPSPLAASASDAAARRADHPTPSEPSDEQARALSGPPALPVLPVISVRRPPLAAPVPAPARRPSIPPPAFPPVSSAQTQRPTIPPPPKAITLPKPPRPPGAEAVPFAISTPPRATKGGPTENTPTIQITRATGDNSSEFTPTAQIDRLRVPSFGKAFTDRDPTLPRLLPPPGPEVDRDGRMASIAPVAGSVAPPDWRRPPLWKPDRRRSTLAIAAAIFSVGALAFVMRPRAGEVTITAAAADGSEIKGLSVLVDGVERCSSSPCEVKDLKAGTHLVSAAAPGYAASAERAIVLDSGERAAHHVSLTTEQRAHSELSVAAIGSDLHVLVDGRDLGAPPVTVRDIAPGPHSVRVTGDAGYYQPYDESVNVEPGELRSLGPVRLHVLKGKLELVPGTGSDAAMIAVDGKRIGHLPATIDLSANDAHEVVARRHGYADFTRQIVFDGSANQAVEIALTPGEEEPERASSDVLRSTPGAAPVHSASRAVSTTQAAPAGGAGFLDIMSKPPALVVVNGRPMGMSPLHGVRVDPGHQTVVFISPELGRRVASANVSPGAHAKVAMSF